MKLGRKKTGGKYIKRRKKKKHERIGQEKLVKFGEEKRKNQKIIGGNKKTILLRAKFVNVLPKNKKGKAKKLEIKNVIETPSNRFFARQNIITKGTIVETSEGKAKITSKPSQEGTLNGIFLE